MPLAQGVVHTRDVGPGPGSALGGRDVVDVQAVRDHDALVGGAEGVVDADAVEVDLRAGGLDGEQAAWCLGASRGLVLGFIEEGQRRRAIASRCGRVRGGQQKGRAHRGSTRVGGVEFGCLVLQKVDG
ncbi:hypothetical protein [Streptomyces sp. NPDC085479]|uniref:hypothetical protein n=1 Tax=Streptomyces sp. NPDC085479 TaxID=3365726 RepID=UPI0037CEEF71